MGKNPKILICKLLYMRNKDGIKISSPSLIPYEIWKENMERAYEVWRENMR